MSDSPKPDRSNRIILVGLMVLAAVTIGATIISTMGEWNQPEPAPAAAVETSTGEAQEPALPSASY